MDRPGDSHQNRVVTVSNNAAAKEVIVDKVALPEETVPLLESDFYCKLCSFDCVNNTGKLLHSLDASHVEAYQKSRKLASTVSQPTNVVSSEGTISKNMDHKKLPDGKLNIIHSSDKTLDEFTTAEKLQFSQEPPSKDRCRRIIIEGISGNIDKKTIIRHLAKYGLIKSNAFIGATLHVEYIDWQSAERVYAEQVHGKIKLDGKEFEIKKSRKTLNRVLQIGKLSQKIRTLFSSEENLLSQLDGLLESFQLTPQDIENQELACKSVAKCLKYFAPKVVPYGSRVTGLASKDSDLDIYVNITKPFHYFNTKYLRNTQELIIQDAAVDIMGSSDFSCVVQIPKASVPLLSCTHIPSGLKCDLTFRYPYQLHNTDLIRLFLSIDHRVRPFILLIRHWAKSHGIFGKGKFSSYSLTLMCIFYLQQIPSKPILPNVALLMTFAKDHERTSCGIWDCGFSEDISLFPKSMNDSSLFHLLKGFFKFFSNFDLNNSVVCPFLGRTLNKNMFHPGKEHLLPNEFKKYKANCLESLFEPLKVSYPLCIQDPFAHNCNIATQNRDYVVQRFQILCHLYTNQYGN